MKCYYHPDREAVAVCSRCGKPLCKECAKEYKGKIYCKDCLEEIKKEEALKEKEEEKIRTPGKVIVAAILISLGIITLLVFLVFVSRMIVHTKSVGTYSVATNNISAPYNGEHTLNLQINVDDADIEITKGEENSKLYNINLENIHPKVNYNSSSSTLDIESNSHTQNKNRAIRVYISPSVSNVSFSIKDKAGDIEIDGFNSPYTNIAAGAGDIQLSNTTFGKLKIENGAGNIYIENCIIKKDGCSIASGAGDIEFTGTNALGGDIDVKLGTGNFAMGGVKYFKSISVKQGIGICKIDLSNVNPSTKVSWKGWNIDIKSGTGDIGIEMSNLPVRAQVKAVSTELEGDFSKNGNTYNAGDLSSPNVLNISIVSMGNVNLIRR